MSKERILETIGQVKDEFIEEAAPKELFNREEEEEKPIKAYFSNAKIYRFAKWGALAACLCILIGVGMKTNLLFNEKNDAAFEMKDTAMNQSAVTESVMEETKSEAGYGANMEETKAEYSTNGYIKGADGAVKEDTVTSTEAPASDNGFPDWGLTLSVENVTSTCLTLVVTQNGGNPTGNLDTGEAYRLITLEDGVWKAVEELPLPEGVDGRGWNSIAYSIPENETVKFNINWEWIFGELPNGTYRLIKEFMDFRETGDYDTFEYWVEFEIQ